MKSARRATDKNRNDLNIKVLQDTLDHMESELHRLRGLCDAADLLFAPIYAERKQEAERLGYQRDASIEALAVILESIEQVESNLKSQFISTWKIIFGTRTERD